MKEEWRDIPGYEGCYQVSNLGNVKSLNYRNQGIAKELKKNFNNKGYEMVGLRGDKWLVHRLVAKAFLPNPHNFAEINHKDEVPHNNRLDNLEWCDGEYNRNYGTGRQRAIENHQKPLIAVTKEGEIEFYSCVKEAAEKLNGIERNIYRALKGSLKTSVGRTWYYQDDLLKRDV